MFKYLIKSMTIPIFSCLVCIKHVIMRRSFDRTSMYNIVIHRIYYRSLPTYIYFFFQGEIFHYLNFMTCIKIIN